MGKSRQLEKIVEIGVGVQGSAVAFACAVNGIEVYLHMRTEEKAIRAREKLIEQIFDGNIPGLSEEDAKAAAARLRPGSNLEDALANADLAFESVYEDSDYKKKVHAEIGRLAPPHVLIGSNTSSLLCTPLAEASGRADRFFCMNWGDLRYKQRVALLMWNPETSASTKKAALLWAKRCTMVPVICIKDVMGYGFSPIWRVVKKEALHLVDSGVVNLDDVDRFWVLCFGTKLGSFAQTDEIGLDTILNVERQYYEDSHDEGDKPPKILTDLVEAGHLGKKSGKEFYDYPDPAYSQPGWLYKEPPWEENDPDGTLNCQNLRPKKTG